MKKVTGGVLVVLMLSAVLVVGGCATKAQTGAAAGAGVGALAGQAIGGNTSSTLIGAGAGAVGGYIIGNEMDKADGY
ncbi:MAG TPA: glycine zipper domain-containing protein [Planctomycetota bacterium]|nr:glycine zipper domain-containing protein [Planctomycetota bacterium]